VVAVLALAAGAIHIALAYALACVFFLEGGGKEAVQLGVGC
jgi:hypothetical protein